MADAAMIAPTTGWPPPVLAQDECHELFAWFASKPEAKRLVREHCARIAAAQADLCAARAGMRSNQD